MTSNAPAKHSASHDHEKWRAWFYENGAPRAGLRPARAWLWIIWCISIIFEYNCIWCVLYCAFDHSDVKRRNKLLSRSTLGELILILDVLCYWNGDLFCRSSFVVRAVFSAPLWITSYTLMCTNIAHVGHAWMRTCIAHLVVSLVEFKREWGKRANPCAPWYLFGIYY